MDKYTILCTELRGSAQNLKSNIETLQKKADKLQKTINKVTRGDYKSSDLSQAYYARSILKASITHLGEICGAMNTAAMQFSEASTELSGRANLTAYYMQHTDTLSYEGLMETYSAAIVSAGSAAAGYELVKSTLEENGYSVSNLGSVSNADQDAIQRETEEQATYGIGTVVSGIKTLVSNVRDSYENHGWAYDVAEYGKCVLKGAKAVVQIVGGAVSIATGAGIPMGILSVISGVNDICNVAADWTYVSLDAYELVGTTNALKNTLTENGGIIGEYFGNKELGEFLGELTYTGIDVVTFLDSADQMLKSFGKVNTELTGTTGYSWVWGETSFDDVLDNKIKFKLDTKYIIDPAWTLKKVLGVDAASTANFIIDAIDDTKGVYDKAQKLVDQLGELRKG